MDPNTNPEKARTVTIKLTFKPDKSRRGIKTSIATNISLAPPEADETMMLIGQDLRTGRIDIQEYGDSSQNIQVEGGTVPVRAEAIPPAQHPPAGRDPEIGEVYAYTEQRPIDLRKST